MAHYADDWTVRQARDVYFEANGLSEAGYRDRWVWLRAGRLRIPIYNSGARVRAVKLHDLHHIATEYATTWTGETEIAAWELAAGCGRHYPAWLLNFAAVVIGACIAPRRMARAFARGRRSATLYAGAFRDDLLDVTVGELRTRLRLDA